MRSFILIDFVHWGILYIMGINGGLGDDGSVSVTFTHFGVQFHTYLLCVFQ